MKTYNVYERLPGRHFDRFVDSVVVASRVAAIRKVKASQRAYGNLPPSGTRYFAELSLSPADLKRSRNPKGTARDIPSRWTPAKVKRLPGGRIQVRIGGRG